LKKKSEKPKISLTLRQKKLLKSKEPSDFFIVFNEVHNSHLEKLNTNVGQVSINTNGKKKTSNKQKS